MRLNTILTLLAWVAPILPLAHWLVPLDLSQIISHPLPTAKPDLEPEVKAVTTVYVYASAPSSPNTFLTTTTPVSVSPPPASSTIIYTSTEYWSIRIWPPWIKTAALPTPVPTRASESREGI